MPVYQYQDTLYVPLVPNIAFISASVPNASYIPQVSNSAYPWPNNVSCPMPYDMGYIWPYAGYPMSYADTRNDNSEDVPEYRYYVTIERHESEAFGFSIMALTGKSGPKIGRIKDGSPAERCGQLMTGDRVQAVNGISILDMPYEDIANLVQASGLVVTLTMAFRADDSLAFHGHMANYGAERFPAPEHSNGEKFLG